MSTLRGKTLTSLGVLLCLMYVGYRYYSTETSAALLRDTALDHSIQKVSVISPKELTPNETITLPGNVQAWYEAQIYAQVSGYVKMWYKDYGAIVKKDEVLAEVNAPALDAQYAQAKADLETERARNALAQLTAKRYVAMRALLRRANVAPLPAPVEDSSAGAPPFLANGRIEIG